MKLEELIPETGTFKLKKTGDKEFRLRPITGRDEIWIKQTLGCYIDDILREIDRRTYDIYRICFHQMYEEDKATFPKQTVTIINEDGDSIQENLGGMQLFIAHIEGPKEKSEIIKAFMQTVGVSRPKLAEMEQEAEKKTMEAPPTGRPSSTDSPPNTAGQ